MSTHGSYSKLVHSRAPRHAPGAAAQSYYPSTYASAAYDELAASACPPQAKRPQSVARVRSQEDRASILDRIIVSGAVVAVLIGAGSLLIGIGYWFV